MIKYIVLFLAFFILAIVLIFNWAYKTKELECNKTIEIYNNQEFAGLVSGIYIQGECIKIIKF